MGERKQNPKPSREASFTSPLKILQPWEIDEYRKQEDEAFIRIKQRIMREIAEGKYAR